MTKELRLEAVEQFGQGVVNNVITLVDMFDADGVYTTFSDQEDYDSMACIEMLYFDE